MKLHCVDGNNNDNKNQVKQEENINMGQVMELWLSCYLVLLSIDSKTRK